MSKLATVKAIVDIVHVGVQALGIAADKKLARENQERDDKIRALETELAELKRTKK